MRITALANRTGAKGFILTPKVYQLIFLLALGAFAQYPLQETPYQLIDGRNGAAKACSQCYIYTYVAGSTTPLATYTTYTLGVQLPNPVRTNTAGYAVSGSGAITGIWTSGTACYHIVIKDSSAVTITDQDHLCNPYAAAAALVPALQALLAGSGGSSHIGFTQVGGIATTVQQVLRTTARATDYGVIPGSSSDQSAAISAALGTALSNGFNELYFPPGNYKISTGITVPSGIKITCNGPRGSVFTAAANSIIMFSVTSGVLNAFDGCYLDGASHTSLTGIFLDSNVNVAVTKNSFRNFSGSGSIPLKGGGNIFALISDNNFDSTNDGRALDFLASYGLDPTANPYGIAQGQIERNIISAHLGARAEGELDWQDNDIEVVLNAGATAALDASCVPSECFVIITGTHMELSKGTVATLTGINVTAANLSNINISGNSIKGDSSSSSVGINATTSGNPAFFLATANSFRGWATGINLTGLATTYNPGILISANQWRDFVSPYAYITNNLTRNQGSGQTSSSVPTVESGNQCAVQDPRYGNIFCGAFIPGYNAVGNVTVIDVSRGNVFDLETSNTYTGIIGNVTIGNWFFLGNQCGVCAVNPILKQWTTGSPTGFALSAGVDTTIPFGMSIEFVIGPDGIPREKGNQTQWIPRNVADLGNPTDPIAGTPVNGAVAVALNANGTAGVCTAGAGTDTPMMAIYRPNIGNWRCF